MEAAGGGSATEQTRRGVAAVESRRKRPSAEAQRTAVVRRGKKRASGIASSPPPVPQGSAAAPWSTAASGAGCGSSQGDQSPNRGYRPDILDGPVLLGDKIAKLIEVQQERQKERTKMIEKHLAEAKLRLRAAKEQTKAKFLELYNVLLNQDTSQMSEESKATRQDTLEKVELKLSATKEDQELTTQLPPRVVQTECSSDHDDPARNKTILDDFLEEDDIIDDLLDEAARLLKASLEDMKELLVASVCQSGPRK